MGTFHSYVQFFPGDYEQDWIEDYSPISDQGNACAPFFLDGYAPAPLDTRLVIPGSGFVSTPDSAALTLVDADLIVRVALNAWHPGANVDENLITKWAASPDSGFRFYRGQNGFMEIQISTTGANSDNVVTTTKVPMPDGMAIWLRVKHTDSSGDTDFYQAPDQVEEPSTWNTLTLNRTTITGGLFDNAAPVAVGATSEGNSPVNGSIYRAILKSSGVKVADMDPRDWQGGSSWVSSATGEVWTLNGAATVVPRLQPAGAYWGAALKRPPV